MTERERVNALLQANVITDLETVAASTMGEKELVSSD